MKVARFNEIIDEQLEFNKTLLIKKEKEYSENTSNGKDADRLAHFKRTAALLNRDEKEAVFSMLSKHIVSLADMIINNGEYSLELWTEKISDSINYLLILKAMIYEEFENDV